MTHPIRNNPLGLRIIGALKLVKASLLLALAIGLFHMMGGDIGDNLELFVRQLHLDPENKHITKALAAVSGLSQKQLKAIDAGTFVYAILYMVEGVGLLLAKHWAEYLTVIATAGLIPLEIYEIARHVTGLKITVLIVNVAVLVYLIYLLRAQHKAKQAAGAAAD